MTDKAIEFTKGHGTQNDFLVLPDPEVRLDLSSSRISALCDRRRGLGADGVLRVARAGALCGAGVLAEVPEGVDHDDWFMDYRNADGSIAEMCGNGVRVFAHYLAGTGRETRAEFVVGSRAGPRPVTVHTAGEVVGDITVGMGCVRELGASTATIDGMRYQGIGIDVGNPHLACVVSNLSTKKLGELDLARPPEFDSEQFPHGVNVEVLTAIDAASAVDMRVYERGVGETRSCGTGTVAAAAAALAADGFVIGDDTGAVTVRLAGGAVRVDLSAGQAWLRGPSELVATGSIEGTWWHSQSLFDGK